jgi:hypothetical protein
MPNLKELVLYNKEIGELDKNELVTINVESLELWYKSRDTFKNKIIWKTENNLEISDLRKNIYQTFIKRIYEYVSPDKSFILEPYQWWRFFVKDFQIYHNTIHRIKNVKLLKVQTYDILPERDYSIIPKGIIGPLNCDTIYRIETQKRYYPELDWDSNLF